MGKCRSKQCDQEVQSGWSYCPNCGRDNRPNEFRPTILNCSHKFPAPGKYCTVCGEGYGGAKAAAASDANIRFGKTLAFIGAVLVVASMGIKQIMGTGSGPGFQWIHSWYDEVITIPGVATMRGSDLPTYALMLGGALLFFGALGAIAAKANKPKARKKTKSTVQKTQG